MFSVHFNTTICLTSCVFAFGLKTYHILGKLLLVMLLIFLHITCFTKILRRLSYPKHKSNYLFLKYIKRVKHLTILCKCLLQSMCHVSYWILSRWVQWQFNYNYILYKKKVD